MNAPARNQIPVGMKPGLRELNTASVRISESEAVPVKMRAYTREVSGLFVSAEDRRKHYATMLMNLVCQEADANGITLLLLVHPFGGLGPDGPVEPPMSEPQLIHWYERFGFNVLQDTPDGAFMARRVHVKRPNRIVERAVKLALLH